MFYGNYSPSYFQWHQKTFILTWFKHFCTLWKHAKQYDSRLFSVGILQQSLNLFFGCSTYGQKQIPGILWQFCIRKKGLIWEVKLTLNMYKPVKDFQTHFLPSIPYTKAYIKNKTRGLFTFMRGDN